MLLAQFYLHYYAVIEKKKTEKKKRNMNCVYGLKPLNP